MQVGADWSCLVGYIVSGFVDARDGGGSLEVYRRLTDWMGSRCQCRLYWIYVVSEDDVRMCRGRKMPASLES